MRTSSLFSILALLAPTVGCTLSDFDDEHQRDVNVWMTRTLHNSASENAIITQQTLYPYHFKTSSADLTPLGEKTLRTLASHYRGHPGPLNLRKGNAPVALYTARVETVKQALERDGVDVSLVPIRDANPGGDGMWSEDVLVIREAAVKALAEGPSDSSGEGSSSSTSSSARRDN